MWCFFYVLCVHGGRRRIWSPLTAGVTSSCELPYVEAGNQILFLCKSSKHFPPPSHLSSSWDWCKGNTSAESVKVIQAQVDFEDAAFEPKYLCCDGSPCRNASHTCLFPHMPDVWSGMFWPLQPTCHLSFDRLCSQFLLMRSITWSCFPYPLKIRYTEPSCLTWVVHIGLIL